MTFAESNTIPLPKFIYPYRIDDGNYYLDFQESGGGPELTATIDEDWYLPEVLATALETALNAVSGASGTYTVSYSRTTDKFTIETDLDYLDLLWSSGSHAASACHTALGFASGADDTGATSYAADSTIPNRFISAQPIRSPKRDNPWVREVQVSYSGAQTTNWRRQERSLEFTMSYIREQDLASDWNSMLLDSGAARGEPVDFYPNSLDAANYVRAYVDMKGFRPREMVPGLPGNYEFTLTLRQQTPLGGTAGFEDFLTRTVP